MAETITLSADNHLITTREIKEENYAVLRETAIPSVLIEVGFLTNTDERGKLLSPRISGVTGGGHRRRHRVIVQHLEGMSFKGVQFGEGHPLESLTLSDGPPTFLAPPCAFVILCFGSKNRTNTTKPAFLWAFCV